MVESVVASAPLTAPDGDAAQENAVSPTVFEENVRVYLRLRPMNKLEASRRSTNCVEVHDDGQGVTVDSPLEGEFDFTFDRVFDEGAQQSTVYEDVGAPIASHLLDGVNCTLIAYGQTGSGKTHTMMGVGGALTRRQSEQGENVEETEGFIPTSLPSNGNPALRGSARDSGTSNVKGVRMSMEYEEDEFSGLIPRIMKDVFYLTTLSPPSTEFTVRCSYLEVYMEKFVDLLNPRNHNIKVVETSVEAQPENDDAATGMGAMTGESFVDGISEVCCFDESDVLALLVRGNAYRTVSATNMNTDSSRSNAIFIMSIEQRDALTGRTTVSKLHLVDTAGSEMAGKTSKKSQKGVRSSQAAGVAASQQEAKMVNRSLTALAAMVRSLTDKGTNSKAERSVDGRSDHDHGKGPAYGSKLTRVIRDAFGGNCLTSVMLTASSSSYNISETISTIRFGQRCRKVKNRAVVNADLAPSTYKRRVHALEKQQAEVLSLATDIAGDVGILKSSDALKGSSGPLLQKLEAMAKLKERISQEGTSFLGGGRMSPPPAPSPRAGDSPNPASPSPVVSESRRRQDSDDETGESEIERLKNELRKSNEARESAENALAELQSEVAVLKTQSENLDSERKKTTQELIDAKNEIQVLTQRKLEVEHSLRTSQFRENEATVFLRQFRRFYRRLLKNKAAQGTGDTFEITAKVPGVPDLNDLIDVDTLLLESGLIEEEELHDDTGAGTYVPSSDALVRSSVAAKQAAKVADTIKTSEGIESEDVSKKMENPAHGSDPDGETESTDGSDSDGNKSHDDESDIGPQLRGMGSAASRSSVGAGPNANAEETAGADAGAGAGTDMLAPKRSDSLLPPTSINSVRGSLYAPSSITQQQKVLETPSGKLATMRERVLERDLLQMTERCIELQLALNEEKANVDILTNRSGQLSKKRLASEAISLQQALDRKTNDLQAIIWKMNELHLINKTYNEKMANRDQHVNYLEKNLSNLQRTNQRIVTEHQEAERKLQEEVDNLKGLLAAMTIPLWQFGETGLEGRNLLEVSRIVIPFRGGERPTEDDDIEFEPRIEHLSDVEEDDEHEQEQHDTVSSARQPSSGDVAIGQASIEEETKASTSIGDETKRQTFTEDESSQFGPRRMSVMTSDSSKDGHKIPDSQLPRFQEGESAANEATKMAAEAAAAGAEAVAARARSRSTSATAGDGVFEEHIKQMEEEERQQGQKEIEMERTPESRPSRPAASSPISFDARSQPRVKEPERKQEKVPQSSSKAREEKKETPPAAPSPRAAASVDREAMRAAKREKEAARAAEMWAQRKVYADPPVQADGEGIPEGMLVGARHTTYQPQRFAPKLGPTIKPGVLKEHKKKYEDGGSVGSSSRGSRVSRSSRRSTRSKQSGFGSEGRGTPASSSGSESQRRSSRTGLPPIRND